MITLDQPDLFGEYDAEIAAQHDEQTRRRVDALTCLRDEHTDALEIVMRLTYWRDRDTTKPAASDRWAYATTKRGLRHEPADKWWRDEIEGARGWDRLPADLTTWAELCDMLAADPRRVDLVDYAASLTAPDKWRDLYRPCELWPNPGLWHDDYIKSDHTRPGWAARREAWNTTITILTDAIRRLEATE